MAFNFEGVEIPDEVKTELEARIADHVRQSHAKTFGEVDSFIKEVTGVDKSSDKQYTSGYLKEALPLFKESLVNDTKRTLTESFETEKQSLLEKIDKSDNSQLIKDHQAAVDYANTLKTEGEKQIQEIQEKHAFELQQLQINSKMPKALNSPLYKHWKDEVSARMVEMKLSFAENGKIAASEATHGVELDMKDFIKSEFPQLESLFEEKADLSGVQTGDNKIRQTLVNSAKTTGDLIGIIDDQVKQEYGINKSSPRWDQAYQTVKAKYASEFKRLA